jgi:hypothetical protein
LRIVGISGLFAGYCKAKKNPLVICVQLLLLEADAVPESGWGHKTWTNLKGDNTVPKLHRDFVFRKR